MLNAVPAPYAAADRLHRYITVSQAPTPICILGPPLFRATSYLQPAVNTSSHA
jgi:hypothetical protein